MASTKNEESPLASFLANLRREVAEAEADHHCEQQEEQDESTNDDHTSVDSSSVSSSSHVSFTIVSDHARTHQRRQPCGKKRRSTPREQDVAPRCPRHSHYSIQRQLSPVSVSSVESSPEVFSTQASPSSSRNSSKRLLQKEGTTTDLQLFATPLLDSNLSRWEIPSTSVTDRSPGELCKPRRGLDFVSESEVSTKEPLSSSSPSSYGLFVPFSNTQDEEEDEEEDALEDVRTSRWDAIVSVTKALSIARGDHSHSSHCTFTAPKMIPRKSSLVDLNDLFDESDE
mmetsp:Transcript_58304/g.142553  ORF Transcript_58304/g.142553 Transcript_58304/m.142553 type:complete len:285 (+) Transcript_58304:247-1101(+)|eukprot:CAMPEP_0113468498 /NCGR_PEP_ID=MMETSP0014_2-20120614/15389_1 /TAXON_ID=2857 /ORGANISM="Nitzschia sp." /LENGTH=284 /DNA_ID=CAMNT_0000360895 /DNA_START=464 /DNA_END=1318 /DNA_ORIENTATION=- /assembly_acc=CAM_ASM_000159